MPARPLDLFQVGNKLVPSEIDHIFLKDFAVTDDSVERRAQLVAHIGEELGFVLACRFELPPLVMDFLEQSRVLDRKC